MNLRDSALFREITEIGRSGAKPVFSRWECIIHANGKDVKPLFIIDIDVERNYIENFCDVTSIEVAIPQGLYNYDVVPYKSNLEITLRRIALSEDVNPTIDTNQAPLAHRYRATLYDNKSPLMESNSPIVQDKELGDRADYQNVKFQLLDPVVERLRMQTTGGVFRKTTGIDLVRALLGKYSKDAGVEKATRVLGVTLAPNANTEVREHIMVPHLTPLSQVPAHINQICGGVYSAGFGYYLQKQYWYLYAPYDVTAYTKSRKTLTVVNVPANRMAMPERSYRETPTQVIVAATGEVKHHDPSEQEQLNSGNAVRFIDANKIMEGFATIEDNKAIISRSANAAEIVGEKRETGLNYAPASEKRITANFLTELGRLARRSGSFIQLAWENAEPDLLYPGMPVKLMYLQNNTPVETLGILIGVQAHIATTNKSPTNRRYATNAAITLFVDRKIKISE